MNNEEKIQYIKDNYPSKGLKEIAKSLGWSSADPVRKRLHELGILLRRRGALLTGRQSTITPHQHEILEGWLLSDGGLECSGTVVTPFFRLSLTQPAAIAYTQSHLPFSFAKVWERKAQKIKWAKKDQYVLRSHCDRSLLPYLNRWYSNGKKRIPLDFVITPTTMRFAIYGDGTVQFNSHSLGTYSLTLCIEAFSQADKERLILQLNGLGFTFKMNNRGRPFICGKDNLNKFLDWLGKPELECYAYKLSRPSHSNEKESTAAIELIRSLSKPNVSNGYVASELNRTGLRTYRETKFSSWVVRKIRKSHNFPVSKVKSGNSYAHTNNILFGRSKIINYTPVKF